MNTPSPTAHRIDLSKNGLSIDDTLILEVTVPCLTTILGEPRTVLPESNEPNEYGNLPDTLHIWDEAGVWASSKDGVNIHEVTVRLADDAAWANGVKYDIAEREPRSVFGGTFTIEGQAPLDAVPEEELQQAHKFIEGDVSDEWNYELMMTMLAGSAFDELTPIERIHAIDRGEVAASLRSQRTPFRTVSMGYTPKQQAQAAPSKWLHQPVATQVLTFDTPAFAYAIIQDLMYDQGVLTPQFDVYDFAKSLGTQSFDPGQNDGAIIPAVREWFNTLPVPAELAARVTELYLDGGNDIYLQLAPLWDGQDEQFAIHSISTTELSQFPNLKKVEDVAGLLSSGARKQLEDAGVEVTN